MTFYWGFILDTRLEKQEYNRSGKEFPMNTEEPYRDQAERLRRRIEQINEQITVEDKEILPPREQLHRQKKKKTKIKLKYPLIRLLVLFFILLPIIIFSVISYLDGRNINGSVKTSGDSKGYEAINLNNPKSSQSSKKDVEPNKEAEQQKEEETQETKETTKENKQEPVNQNNQESTEVEKPATTEKPAEQQVGQPNSTSNKDTSSKAPVTQSKNENIIYHTVRPQETLFRIAMKYYHSPEGMVIIQKENHLSSDQIEAGQVLKIKLNP